MNLVSLFNHLLASMILILWSFWPIKPTFHSQVSVPSSKLENSASISATLSVPQQFNTSGVQQSSPNVPWGTTQKITNHEYRTFVANDPAMGTQAEILTDLNIYRRNHNVSDVRSDTSLCQLAQTRAIQQEKLATLDDHKGLINYMNDSKHWQELNITAIGENASYGYVLSGTHLIEWVFDSDIEHRENQLNPNWNLACAGISGVTVDIIFGKR